MTAPRLRACYFESAIDTPWARLARVLEVTARAQCPDWDVDVCAITPVSAKSAIGYRPHIANTQKLEHWRARVAAAENGDRILLIDADTAIVRPLDDIWDQAFDFAYTTKPATVYPFFPFNGGVVFLRVSDRIKTFVEDWAATNHRLLTDRTPIADWRKRFGGINQAALGLLLPTAAARGLHVLELPCAEWNCEESAWTAYDAARTRIVHIKGKLRKAVFRQATVPPGCRSLVDACRQLEAGVPKAHPA